MVVFLNTRSQKSPQATMHYQHIKSIVPTPTACADQEEDVDIGTNDAPYEQSVPAEDMEVDEKPQVGILTVCLPACGHRGNILKCQ